MKKQGTLVVVSGFAGTGKGTVMKELLGRYDSYALSISATTRNPRPGEADGREYFFKTVDEFKQMIEKEEFVEHACYVGNYYGTPKKYVQEQLEAGADCNLFTILTTAKSYEDIDDLLDLVEQNISFE